MRHSIRTAYNLYCVHVLKTMILNFKFWSFFCCSAAKYDAEKEAKEEKEAKDKKLAKIEEARKKEEKCMNSYQASY